MNEILDAIRLGFTNKSSAYRDSTPALRALSTLERGVLRTDLPDALMQLRLVLTRMEEASLAGVHDAAYALPPELAAALTIKDETGYLRQTVLTLLTATCWLNTQGMQPDMSLFGELGPLSYTPCKLSFFIKISVDLHHGRTPKTYQEGPFLIEGLDLDTLGGAGRALEQVKRSLNRCLVAAPNGESFQRTRDSILSDSQEAFRRDDRIRAAFRGLPAEDRQHLAALSRQTPLSVYFA